MKKPVEAKVQAGSLSAAASGVVLWVLVTYVFPDGMPQGAESLVYAVVPALLAGAGAYFAPHTHRPDLAPPAAPSNVKLAP
jgi:hypothetical protein